MGLRALIACAALAVAAASAPGPAATFAPGDAARGWGDDFDWRPLPAALAAANATGKPALLLIWKTWCGACKALRPLFAASDELRAAAADFAALVNAADDEEPAGAQYAPDGGYIPRVLFLSPHGDVITEPYAQNPGAGDKYRCAASASPRTRVYPVRGARS